MRSDELKTNRSQHPDLTCAVADVDWNCVAQLSINGTPELINSETLLLPLNSGDLVVRMYEFGIRISSRKQRDVDYGLLTSESTPRPLRLESFEEQSELTSDTLILRISHHPLAFSLHSRDGKCLCRSATDGHFVRRHRIPAFARTDQGWLFSMELQSGEPIYGLGEKWGPLNKRGELVRSYNRDALGVNAEISYKNTPFCWSPDGWGVFVHTPAPVTHSIGYAPWSNRSYAALVEDDILDFFVFAEADTPGSNSDRTTRNWGAKVIGWYTQLTGRAPLPPVWSIGTILSKAYYKTADEILDAAQQVRARGMPCDVITFDGRAWQDTDTRFAFEWSPSRYPDPGAIIDQLKALNFKICVWEYPLISVKHRWFTEFASKGWLLKDQRTGDAYEYVWDRQAFGEVLTPLPNSGIVDFTHPDAYAFWREAHKPLFDLGVDMIKADFGEQLEDNNIVAHNGEGGKALHNVYAFLYNQCVYDAAQKYSASGPFLFSRASWTGCQRFNSQWGGDPQADWEGMMANIRGGMSWGLSGAPFYATDVGGFYKDTRDDNLYVRWIQAAIFSAHLRLHGIGAREPWSYSDQACRAALKALALRYRLRAYLWTTIKAASETGLPVQRPMVLAFPDQPQSWAFENQFMFGEDLLVAPCFRPDHEVRLYLPDGEWVKFDMDNDSRPEILDGGRAMRVTLALDEIAVYTRADAKIPLSSSVEYIDPELDIEDSVTSWRATQRGQNPG